RGKSHGRGAQRARRDRRRGPLVPGVLYARVAAHSRLACLRGRRAGLDGIADLQLRARDGGLQRRVLDRVRGRRRWSRGARREARGGGGGGGGGGGVLSGRRSWVRCLR